MGWAVVVLRARSWALQSQQMLHHLPGHERCDFGLCLVLKTSDISGFLWGTHMRVNPVQRREAFYTTSHRSLWCTWGHFCFSGEQWYQLWDQIPLCSMVISHSSKGIFGTVTKGKSQPGSTRNPRWKWNKSLANYVAHHDIPFLAKVTTIEACYLSWCQHGVSPTPPPPQPTKRKRFFFFN